MVIMAVLCMGGSGNAHACRRWGVGAGVVGAGVAAYKALELKACWR